METIRTRIWHEEADPDNAFAALSCHCHGYDVYGDLLGHASAIARMQAVGRSPGYWATCRRLPRIPLHSIRATPLKILAAVK